MGAPWGVAVGPDGTVFFTDERRGGLFQIKGTGAPHLLIDDLKKPRGLAWEGPGRLLLVAEGLRRPRDDEGSKHGPLNPRGLLLRFDIGSGALRVLAEGLTRPRGVLRSEEGVVYLTADGRREAESAAVFEEVEEEEEPPDLAPKRAYPQHGDLPGTVFRWSQSTGLEVVAEGFQRPDALALGEGGSLFVAAEGYRRQGLELAGSLFRIGPDGSVTAHFAEALRRPAGVVRDATGAFFLGGDRHRQRGHGFDGVVVKLSGDQPPIDFAAGLAQPGGTAFDAEGHLLLADAKAGLILRFHAPPRPRLTTPDRVVTNQDPFRLTGTAQAFSQILVLGGRERATALSDGAGAFSVPVPLKHDQRNDLLVFAIASRGKGLASLPAMAVATHDGVAPTISASIDPPPNAAGWNRTDVRVTFTCTDAVSGIASCSAPTVVTSEGAGQVVTGTAIDQAGNTASASATVNLDRTRPNVAIASPRDGDVLSVAPVTVTGAASDALSGIAGVDCNGSTASLSNSTFTCDVPLTGGPSSILVQVTDRVGNAASASITVSFGRPDPPPTGEETGTPVTMLRLSVSDLQSNLMGGPSVEMASLTLSISSLVPPPGARTDAETLALVQDMEQAIERGLSLTRVADGTTVPARVMRGSFDLNGQGASPGLGDPPAWSLVPTAPLVEGWYVFQADLSGALNLGLLQPFLDGPHLGEVLFARVYVGSRPMWSKLYVKCSRPLSSPPQPPGVVGDRSCAFVFFLTEPIDATAHALAVGNMHVAYDDQLVACLPVENAHRRNHEVVSVVCHEPAPGTRVQAVLATNAIVSTTGEAATKVMLSFDPTTFENTAGTGEPIWEARVFSQASLGLGGVP